MWIVELKANANGSHNDHRADHITFPPEGWAVIPEGFTVPSTFPFVRITAKEQPSGAGGTMMTVTAMEECTPPDLPAPEEAPSQLDQIEAQVTYTAMMTDTLLEV